MAAVRVLLVDGQALIRESLAIILGAAQDIEVVGQAADGKEAVELARELRPDVVLMDIRMPGVNGIEATRHIKQELPLTQILILTTYSDDELVFEGIRAGSVGYLLKDITRAQLVDAIRGAAQGEAQIAPAVASQVLAEFQRMANILRRHAAHATQAPAEPSRKPPSSSPKPDSLPEIEALTPREEAILHLLTQGLTNAAIATHLHLSEGTVKNYVSDIRAKLHANDRTHAVVLAIKRGLVDLPRNG